MTIEWQDPPPIGHGRRETKWAKVLSELRTRPGQWALVMEGVSVSNGYVLRKRFPGFEFTTRVEDGDIKHARIFARYIGESVPS